MIKKKTALAEERTVDMFTGKSREDEKNEAQHLIDDRDLGESTREKVETIEQAADSRRETAFQGQQWTTKHFGIPDAQGRQFRVSIRQGWCYLEQTDGNGGGAYHYAGVMFPEYSLPRLCDCLVPAARAYLAKTKTVQPDQP